MSVEKVKISNRKLASPKFWESFTTIMGIKELKVIDKLALVKLKSQIMIEVEAAREVLKNVSAEDAMSVMDRENDFTFSPIAVPLDKLTAEELYQLEGLYKEE